LGKYSQLEEPLIFITELVAFFRVEGPTRPEFHKLGKDGVCTVRDGGAGVDPKARPTFFGPSRTAFGIVKIRTDGQRLLVYTDSGQSNLKEAYAYTIDSKGKPQPAPVTMAL